jgi:hypothetical protein
LKRGQKLCLYQLIKKKFTRMLTQRKPPFQSPTLPA